MKSNTKEKVLIGIGLACIVMGTLCFVPIVTILFQQHRIIEAGNLVTSFRIAIGSIAVLLIGWGFITIIFRRREIVTNLNIFFVSSVIVAPLFMEVILRAGVAFGPSVFRTPELYASPYSDNDYFKLLTIWQLDKRESKLDNLNSNKATPISDLAYDQVLGWVYLRSSDNPLGVLTDTRYDVDAGGNSILFYGDSYVAHGKRMQDKIPQQLDRLRPDDKVFNYGVPGYGLDQSYLRFKQSHHSFKKPIIIFGILTVDIDRCILKYRDRPKPYFVIKEDRLVLEGIPVMPDKESYIKKNPLSVSSYFGAAFIRLMRYLNAGAVSANDHYKRAEKERISRKIIEQIVHESRKNALDLRFVIFVQRVGGGWRKSFLMHEMDRLGVTYIDTEEVLLRALPKSGNFSALYYDETDHHNELANSIIAKAIAKQINNTSS